MGKDVEGSGRDLVWGITEENLEGLLIGTRYISATRKKEVDGHGDALLL
jgi:hypothetical protein